MTTEKIYRYRTWDVNVWFGSRRKEITPEQIEAGWGEWEIISEQKYKEICEYIEWPNPSHYQVQALDVVVAEDKSFNPAKYIEHERAKQSIPTPAKTKRISLFRTFNGNEWSPWLLAERNHVYAANADERIAQIEYAAALEFQGTYGSLKIGNVLRTTFTFHNPEHERTR